MYKLYCIDMYMMLGWSRKVCTARALILTLTLVGSLQWVGYHIRNSLASLFCISQKYVTALPYSTVAHFQRRIDFETRNLSSSVNTREY